ncbi:hypothetical protein CCMA1212_005282 [Trichoderma ghanense]|uniref:Uncharacterized protein n=1 Tax=Trichoderma ghanense TaxID=65468 RepID=A0ABY2H6J2_9HYPO
MHASSSIGCTAPYADTISDLKLAFVLVDYLMEQSVAVVVNGKPVWQFQHGVDVAQAVLVCVTTPATCEQPQGRVTTSGAGVLEVIWSATVGERESRLTIDDAEIAGAVELAAFAGARASRYRDGRDAADGRCLGMDS